MSVSVGISVLILTKNEQWDLPDCLDSVSWSDDIHVLDSGSADDTCEIARARGAHVIIKTYADSAQLFGGDEAAHRNWSLRNVPFKNPWVLQLDADERVTDGLRQSLLEFARAANHSRSETYDQNSQEPAAFRIVRRDIFMGRWLRHVQLTSTYVRFFRPQCLHYERLINPVSVVDGSIGTLPGYLEHLPFSKGIAHWLDRHNGYSTLEAHQIVANQRSGRSFSFRKALFARDAGERRQHRKELFYRMPARPLVKFIGTYFGRGGFLDGNAGLTYSVLQAIYEYMIVLKVSELYSKDDSRSRTSQHAESFSSERNR